MDLIIKPTERCNFKCTFCSSTKITDTDASAELDLDYVYRFLTRYPETRTIIVNGGDPLMIDPDYYWDIIRWLDTHNRETTISLTTNLWPFYVAPAKWLPLFRHARVGVSTSFQYGGGRLKGDLSEFSEDDFWKVSNLMLEEVGYRPDFISVITHDNAHDAIKNVLLAQKMNVVCKLNYAMSSGPVVFFKNIRMGQQGKPFMLADIYEIYVKIHNMGLTQWEYNTQQMIKRTQGIPTTCPQTRSCDYGIRTLQPQGDYYSCGAFGDDQTHKIDFENEMNGEFYTPLQHDPYIQTMTDSCYGCPMFDICNGCRKTIKDMKDYNMASTHCAKMKTLAYDILRAGGMSEYAP